MGCLQRRDYSNLKMSDEFSKTESKLYLKGFKFSQFYDVLIRAAIDRQITLEQLGRAFSRSRFGKEILSSENTVVKQVLQSPTFKAREATLDVYDVFSLGFLYCKGNVNDKVSLIFKQFDFNENGFLQRDKMGLILKDIIEIGSTVIPAIQNGISYEDATKFTEPDTTKCRNDALDVIFPQENSINREDLTVSMQEAVKHLNNAVMLRQQMKIDWNQYK